MTFQTTAEVIFDFSYLITAFILGILILLRSGDKSFKIFGTMTLVLVIPFILFQEFMR